ncbi:MAG: histone deacetylase [Polyangiaceae bacterium]|nr:histone deacetylase [Polyangiaceae bacterium]
MVEHDPGAGHSESPARLQAIKQALDAAAMTGVVTRQAEEALPALLHQVHSVDHVQRICSLRGVRGRLDPDTIASPETARAAMLAAGSAVAAVEAVCRGDQANAFALLRPPGHHAERDRAMGFCFLNNVALAAAHARSSLGIERVLIVDWDVHHGNGTQEIFYNDASVLYFSAHQFPFYPGSGGLGELGAGEGIGYTVNLPFAAGASDGDYELGFRDLLAPLAAAFQPELVLVSAGFDAHQRDPLGGMRLTGEGFAALCGQVKRIADQYAGGQLVLLLEGGYDLLALGGSVVSCLEVLGAPTGSEPATHRNTTVLGEQSVLAALSQHRQYWDL